MAPRQPRQAVAAVRAKLAALDPNRTGFLRLDIKGEITDSLAAKVTRQLSESNARTVWTVVDSHGGDFDAAVAIYNALREHPGRKVTNCYGLAQSAGLLVYLAGDIRNASPSAKFLLHAAEARIKLPVARWTASLHTIAARYIREADDTFAAIVAERTCFHPQALAAEMRTEADMPILKAIANGVVHHVPGITPPLDPEWPAKARGAVSASLVGWADYRLAPGYLTACRMSPKVNK